MTVNQLYEQTIKPLSPAERLRLATLILNGIPPQSVVDYSDEWSDAKATVLQEYHLEKIRRSGGIAKVVTPTSWPKEYARLKIMALECVYTKD